MGSFGERYQMVRRLGRGGMGEVWLAHDVGLGNRSVAIKIMHSHMLGEAGDVSRFQQEMLLASRMQHPNIMTVFTTGTTDDNVPFMVMEYLEGHDLSKSALPQPASEVARIGKGTCAALAFAHSLNPGVVHRDIKPANLFLCDTGLVKVTDFGIAKAIAGSKLSTTLTLTGTLPYMAPEQWLGERAGYGIDVWATGCALYELLTGKRAREFENVSDYIGAAARRERVPPLTSISDVPAWLAGVVMGMLEPNPADRPTAADCIQMLSASPGEQPARQRTPGTGRSMPQVAVRTAASPGPQQRAATSGAPGPVDHRIPAIQQQYVQPRLQNVIQRPPAAGGDRNYAAIGVTIAMVIVILIIIGIAVSNSV